MYFIAVVLVFPRVLYKIRGFFSNHYGYGVGMTGDHTREDGYIDYTKTLYTKYPKINNMFYTQVL